MKETIASVVKVLVLLALATVIFYNMDVESTSISKDKTNLIIYGDNVDKKYNPIIEDGKIYISFATISQFIDDKIFYDSETQKVIITNEDNVYKFVVGSNMATKNMKSYDANGICKDVGEQTYIDMTILKDVYNIKSSYDEDTNTVSIDKKDNSDIKLNYNGVNLYSDIRTNSKVLETLNKDNSVVVYVDSLNHSRWYKVKSDSGKIGYIEKSAVTIENVVDENENKNEENKDKLVMFWQYGSNLDTLGNKIDGVGVVMPTWYSVSDEYGTIDLEYDKEYYQKAKSYGYDIWPIITNSFGSQEVSSKDLTSKLINSETNRESLIQNIVEIVKNNNLDGINIDFEDMYPEDKYMFNQFLRELRPMLKEAGAKLSVDVYFTNYIDRKGVGDACDYFILMGYDQRGDWSGSDIGSIAEATWVDENVESLINDSNVDPQKIIIGVPFYTRLWEINQDNEVSSTIYSMQSSQEFINKYGLEKTWDEKAGQNYVETVDGNTTYKLWIEDKDSIARRVETVNKYNLAGITAWRKGFETEDIWDVIMQNIK